MKIVLDTNVIIDFLRQPKKITIFRKLLQEKKFKILFPAVILTELYIGKSSAKASGQKKLREVLRKTEIILADEEISKKAGILMRKHSNLYLADALVAATALKEEAFLCTFNKAHFEKIPALKLFSWENL